MQVNYTGNSLPSNPEWCKMGSVIINGPTKCKCGVELTFQTTYAVWKSEQLGPLCRACYLEEQAKRFWEAHEASIVKGCPDVSPIPWSELNDGIRADILAGLEAVL